MGGDVACGGDGDITAVGGIWGGIWGVVGGAVEDSGGDGAACEIEGIAVGEDVSGGEAGASGDADRASGKF